MRKMLVVAFVVSLSLIGIEQKLYAATPSELEENTGAEASVKPRIPEPMVFDLIRPLGADKGELEINILGQQQLRASRNTLQWAPEIEYAFADGYAVEFELPFGDFDLEEMKLAVQGTISKHLHNKYIHGWQMINRVNLDHNNYLLDLLHISGYKINKQWSLLGLYGFKQQFNSDYQLSPLANLSVFREFSDRFRLGLETNYQYADLGGDNGSNNFLLMPQAHLELDEHFSIQLGAGVTRLNEAFSTVFASRLVFEF